MLKVLIPSESEFKKFEVQIRALYEKSQEKMCDTNPFEFVRDNTLFYMFIYDGKLVGGIYYFKDGDKLFLNGFANRKMFAINLDCVRLSTTWFNCDIYAEAQNRASALCLLKCGFKRVNDNLFCLKKV